MPDAAGNLKGHGWSRRYEDNWSRLFGPAVLEDPTPDEPTIGDPGFVSLDCSCGWAGQDWNVAIQHVCDEEWFHEVKARST